MNLYQISSAISAVTKQLEQYYQSNAEARRIASELIGLVTGLQPLEIILQNNRILTHEEWEQVQRHVEEHISLEKPLAYILKSHPFLSLQLELTPPILIPRPETEWWTNLLIQQLQQLPDTEQKALRILDLCTGSGCIALALAQTLPKSYVVGLDIKPHAVDCATQNAQRNAINNVTFIQSDLYTSIAQEKFDLIVANPPYISKVEYQKLEKSVHDWEDPRALWAPEDGTMLIASIVQNAPKHLTTKLKLPRLWVEIGYNQAFLAQKLSTNTMQLVAHPDQFGQTRLLIEQIP